VHSADYRTGSLLFLRTLLKFLQYNTAKYKPDCAALAGSSLTSRLGQPVCLISSHFLLFLPYASGLVTSLSVELHLAFGTHFRVTFVISALLQIGLFVCLLLNGPSAQFWPFEGQSMVCSSKWLECFTAMRQTGVNETVLQIGRPTSFCKNHFPYKQAVCRSCKSTKTCAHILFLLISPDYAGSCHVGLGACTSPI